MWSSQPSGSASPPCSDRRGPARARSSRPLRARQCSTNAWPAPARPLTRSERAALEPVRSFIEPRLDETWTIRGLLAWSTLFGTISLELFGHMYRGVLDYDAHFAQVVDQLAADLGLA